MKHLILLSFTVLAIATDFSTTPLSASLHCNADQHNHFQYRQSQQMNFIKCYNVNVVFTTYSTAPKWSEILVAIASTKRLWQLFTMWISNNGMTCLSAFVMACWLGHIGDIFCMCTHRKSLSHSLPRRRPASPRILIQHASPEDDRYPVVDPEPLSSRAWLDLMPLLYDTNPEVFCCIIVNGRFFFLKGNVSLIPKLLFFLYSSM